MTEARVPVRPLGEGDRPAVAAFLEQSWGSLVQVVHGTVFRPAELPGFLAGGPPGPVSGLLTYQVRGRVLEIVTLDAAPRQAGTGTALVEAAAAEAARQGCAEVRLTTTNDNTDALRFYQRRGFRLLALRPGAVAEARAVKPSIPDVGEHGIPLRDEIDLTRPVTVTRPEAARPESWPAQEEPGGLYHDESFSSRLLMTGDTQTILAGLKRVHSRCRKHPVMRYTGIRC